MEYEFRNIKVKDGDVIEIPHDIRDFKIVNVVEMDDSNYHRPLPTNSTYVQWFELSPEEMDKREKRLEKIYSDLENMQKSSWWRFW